MFVETRYNLGTIPCCFDWCVALTFALVLKASATVVRAQGLGDLDHRVNCQASKLHSVDFVSEVGIINLSILKECTGQKHIMLSLGWIYYIECRPLNFMDHIVQSSC